MVPGVEPQLRAHADAARGAQRRSRDLRLACDRPRRGGAPGRPVPQPARDPERDRAGLLEPTGPAPLEPPYLLCVGTPEPRKNLPALLEAFTLVRAAGRRVRLALVGADGWGDVRVGSTEGVVAFGRVDDSELRDLYAHAEALVLPSLWEGFGLPVAEALAAGCRVACSNIPALRELAGEDATYFDPATPEAISEGILKALLAPRPAPRRGTSWDDAAASVVALWRELVQ